MSKEITRQIGRGPIFSKSNWLHVDIFQFFLLFWGLVYTVLLNEQCFYLSLELELVYM